MGNQRRLIALRDAGIKRNVFTTTLILICLLLSITIINAKNGLISYFKRMHTRNKLETDITQLKKQNEDIKKEIDLINDNDSFFIEQKARELGLQYPDEIIFKFERQEPNPSDD